MHRKQHYKSSRSHYLPDFYLHKNLESVRKMFYHEKRTGIAHFKILLFAGEQLSHLFEKDKEIINCLMILGKIYMQERGPRKRSQGSKTGGRSSAENS